MLRIYCPYCGTSYNIDESLMPEDNIKTRCRSCANIFIINKENGAIRDELKHEYKPETASLSENEPASENKLSDEENTEVSDLMKLIIQEIDGSLSEENNEKENTGKKKINIFQIIPWILLILLIILAGVYILDYYGIININLP